MDKSLHVGLTFFLTQLGIIFFIYPEHIIASSSEGHWLPILAGAAANLIVMAVYMKGLGYFSNQDIISIYTNVGKSAAVLFLVPVIFYLYMVNVIAVRAFAEIITIVFLSNTPIWAVTGLLLFISTYIAANGIASIFRTGVLLAILFLPSIGFILTISFQNVDWHYILPLIEKRFEFLTSISYMKSFYVFATSFLFLGFVQPEITYSSKKLLLAALSLIPFLLLAVYIPVLTFGRSTASTFKFPFVMLVGTIHVNWLMFDRVTLFLLLSLITFTMLFIALLIWQMSRMISRPLPKVKPVYLLLFISAVTYIGCIMIPNWQDVEELFICNMVLRIYVWLIIPFSIYFLGLREKRKRSYEPT
ncbi:GerAB/ArcD/ProY family transporter [Paenibacillus harenae]|uniref:GerAB/ArcD/ProY family transporter n=1 Tax=Paenibacillus harenae TaxID=306543 RepID=UPI0003FB5FE5|nr:GerAB/ArcD/ProY family transporter [Paenibacillus harenae]